MIVHRLGGHWNIKGRDGKPQMRCQTWTFTCHTRKWKYAARQLKLPLITMLKSCIAKYRRSRTIFLIHMPRPIPEHDDHRPISLAMARTLGCRFSLSLLHKTLCNNLIIQQGARWLLVVLASTVTTCCETSSQGMSNDAAIVAGVFGTFDTKVDGRVAMRMW